MQKEDGTSRVEGQVGLFLAEPISGCIAVGTALIGHGYRRPEAFSAWVSVGHNSKKLSQALTKLSVTTVSGLFVWRARPGSVGCVLLAKQPCFREQWHREPLELCAAGGATFGGGSSLLKAWE
ncbi:hypothetical protein [Hymenobacter glaciei]|uniref:hypothetical protein n=1 Tax=Hymenobacter glaciei TaxID=877209 RepID=UPI0031E4EF0F